MPTIILNFEDGVTRIIESNPYETVSDAAYRLGINIPLDCADGACGTCKCLCKSGNYDPGDYIDEALTDEEAEEGFGLACQMRPETDLVVEILASSAACKVEVSTYKTTISEVTFLSSEIVKLGVITDNNSKIGFLPGQYVNIEVPGSAGQTRSYSFVNRPDSSELTYLIRLVPEGLMSNYLRNEAKIGDTLQLKGPLGSFYSREITKPTLFFAGGTGIAPFISMLEKIATQDIQHPIILFYGATTEENLVELDRLNSFTEKLPLRILSCVSCNDYAGQVAKGFVTQWINKQELTQREYDVYICGPNAMVDAVKDTLATNEINYENFYLEKFLPTGDQ